MKKLKFCFFGEIAGALVGKTVGGAQIQVALLAKALALKGHEVVIIDPFASENFTTPEGIQLITVPEWSNGIVGLRMFTHRIPALYRLFKAQKADYYYVRARSYVNLTSYLAAKKNKGKFIHAIASDIDVFSLAGKFKHQYKASFHLPSYLFVQLPNDLALRYLLKKSDLVMLQHTGQYMKEESIKSRSVIFPNIIDHTSVSMVPNPTRDYFIHVGSLSILKGANNLYKLVEMLNPQQTIMVVGQPNGQRAKAIYEKLRTKKNVILTGRVNHAETLRLIANSKALINTSNFEGFPNIFLEAWSAGVPVISLNVNPGNIFEKHNLGYFCHGDMNKMKETIETFKEGKIDKESLVGYVRTNHDFSTAADRFLHILDSVK